MMNAPTPRWQDLFLRLIQQEHDIVPSSEVELYQAQAALGFDLDIAWNEAILPGKLLAKSESPSPARYPSSWTAAKNINLNGPFPCCVGMAPQFIQNINRLMDDASAFFQQENSPLPTGMIAEQTLDNKTVLSQLAIARLAGDGEQADHLIHKLEGEQLQKNELAASLWLEGKRDEARQAWHAIASEHPVIAFNKGISSLASGQIADGKKWLQLAAKGFDESTGWKHLSELYLAAV